MIEQVAIAATGATAVWASQDTREQVRKWACIFGLIGQPFWFYAAYTAGQWGIFAVCFLYAFAWGRGFYNHWVRE